MLRTMTIATNMCTWLTLLIACRCFGNINMGKLCLNEAIKLDPDTMTGYALMSSMYAESHRLEAIYLSIISHFGKISGHNSFGLTWCNGIICGSILATWAILNGEGSMASHCRTQDRLGKDNRFLSIFFVFCS